MSGYISVRLLAKQLKDCFKIENKLGGNISLRLLNNSEVNSCFLFPLNHCGRGGEYNFEINLPTSIIEAQYKRERAG